MVKLILAMILILVVCSAHDAERAENQPTTREIQPVNQLPGIHEIKDVASKLSPVMAEWDTKFFEVELEAAEIQAPIADWPAGEALQVAAEYYAAIHHDFRVSVGEVLAAGLWPYEILPNGADQSSVIFGGRRYRALILERDVDKADELTLIARHEILNAVHEELYKISAALPLQSPASLLRDHRFWVNPDTKSAMQVGSGRGDISEHRFDSMPHYLRFRTAEWVSPGWMLSFVNLMDTKYEQFAD